MAEQLTGKDEIREAVRERYAEAATRGGGARGVLRSLHESEAGGSSCGCGTDVPDACGGGEFGAGLYRDADRDQLPDEAKLASLGCGNPTAVAELHEGETVLDLGSGGGIDVCSRPAASARPARPTAST